MFDPSTVSPVQESPVSSGARARSKERNRLKILDSATQMFRERGFEAATLRDIASAAGLSTGALFANFTDKTEIFLTVVEAEHQRVLAAMRDSYDESLPLVERLHRQLMQGYAVSEANARLILSAFVMKWSADQTALNEVARLSDDVRDALFDTLTKAQARGELPKDAPLNDASEVLEDLCFANMRRAFHKAGEAGGFDAATLERNMLTQLKLVIAGLKA
jgi:AcrR family transcriptional regulator